MILTFVLIFRPTGILGQQTGRSRMTRRQTSARHDRRHAASRSPADATSATQHRSITIIIGMAIVDPAAAGPARVPAAVADPGRPDRGTTRSPTPASSSCWRWASTSSSAWPACSTSATRRSSRSAPTPTPTRTRRSRASTCRSCPMLVVGAGVAAVFGIAARRADAAAARRLPRDHDPRLRRDRPDRLPEPRPVHAAARTGSTAIYRPETLRSARSLGRVQPRSRRSPTSS